jgi:hypothetical protein
VIEAKDLILVADGVPLGKEFCASLAVQTLTVDALKDATSELSEN